MSKQGYDRPRSSASSPRDRRAVNADAGQESVFHQIGIGIGSPLYSSVLHIQKPHSTNVLIDRLQDTNNGPTFQLRKSRGTVDALTAVVDEDYCGLISGYGYVGNTNQFLKGASMEFRVDGTPSDSGSGALPMSMRFRARNAAGATNTICWMDAEGNVGIGNVDDPDQQLEVKGSIHISGEEDLGSVSVANGDGGLLYVKSDGKIYWKSNELAETDLTAAASGEANEESFQTISVAGQDSVVAETDDDTLTLVAGTNVTITTDAAADSITFNAADTNTQLSTEQVQDIVGAMFTSNTETRIAATYEDGDGTIDLVVDDMTANTQLSSEQVQDIVGAMFSSNTETRITATYEDGDGTIDLVVDDMTANTQLSTEQVQDIVGAMFSSNTETRCTVTYQDADGTIDVVVDDLDTNLTTEEVQDIVGAMFSSNTETRITATYEDGDGTIDLVVDDMTANTQLSTEQVQDIVGAMFSSNTETRISATYQDGDGTIDLVVDDMTADTQPLTTEQVQDIVGAMFSSNTETRIAATYQDSDGTIDLVVDDMSGGGLNEEQVQDVVGAMFSGNTETRVSVTYDDADGTIDVVVDDMTADTQLTTEAVQDIVGAMFTSNTETRISATYEDGDGTIDLVVDDMTADTNTQLSTEQVQDIVGAMFSSNTETRCTVTYQDADGTIDVVVDDMSGGGGGGGVSLSGTTNNTVATVTGSDALIGEANLTFDGSTLTVTGNVLVDGGADVNQVKIQGHSSQSASPLLVEQSDGTDVFEVTNTGKVISESGAEFKGNSFKMGDSGGSTNFIHATGANNLNFRNHNANKTMQFDYPASNGELKFRTHNGSSAVTQTTLDSDAVWTHNVAMVATGDAVFKGDTDADLLVVDAGDERVGVSVAAGSMRHRFDCRGSRGYAVNVLTPSGAGYTYTVTESDAIIYADASGLNAGTTLTITLPELALGRIYEVYLRDGGSGGQSVVVAAPSGTLLNGSSGGTVTLSTQYEGVRIVGVDPNHDWIAHEMHMIAGGGGGGGGGGP